MIYNFNRTGTFDLTEHHIGPLNSTLLIIIYCETPLQIFLYGKVGLTILTIVILKD